MSDGPNRSLRFLERERQPLRRRRIPGKLARRLWPELHHFLPDGMNRWESIRFNLVAIVVPFLGALALAWTASRLVINFILAPMLTPSNANRVTSGAVLTVFLVMLLVWLLLALAAPLLCRPWARRYLRWVLRARGVRLCDRCGYDLAGIASDRCPECGRVNERRVPSRPR